jgi:hypothetical protein
LDFKSIRCMPNCGQTTTTHLIKFHSSYNLTQVYKYAREHLTHDNEITIMLGKLQDVPNNHNNNDTSYNTCTRGEMQLVTMLPTNFSQVDILTFLPSLHNQPYVATASLTHPVSSSNQSTSSSLSLLFMCSVLSWISCLISSLTISCSFKFSLSNPSPIYKHLPLPLKSHIPWKQLKKTHHFNI